MHNACNVIRIVPEQSDLKAALELAKSLGGVLQQCRRRCVIAPRLLPGYVPVTMFSGEKPAPEAA